MKHTEMINRIIQAREYSSYLEIGLGTVKNFDAVTVDKKTGVDPNVPSRADIFSMTSDTFFQEIMSVNHSTHDFIFIDGLHHSNQVLRDVRSSLLFLSEGGTIMVHDCNPPNKESQLVPRQTRVWTGDVWKAWVILRRNPDLETICISEDYGCGIIQRGS